MSYMILALHDWPYAGVPQALVAVFGVPHWVAAFITLGLAVGAIVASIAVVNWLLQPKRDQNL